MAHPSAPPAGIQRKRVCLRWAARAEATPRPCEFKALLPALPCDRRMVRYATKAAALDQPCPVPIRSLRAVAKSRDGSSRSTPGSWPRPRDAWSPWDPLRPLGSAPMSFERRHGTSDTSPAVAPSQRLGGSRRGLNTTGKTGIWFPAVLIAYRHVVPLAGEIDSPTERKLALAVRRLLDRQQHAKRREATERRLERAFDAYKAPGGAFADEAPRLKAAAQRIGREREPLHVRDAQRGTEAMKAVAIAGGDERRNRLVGVVRVAARIGA